MTDSLTVKKHDSRWVIWNEARQCRVVGPPQRFEHPDLGVTTISGAVFFNTKKAAEAALQELRDILAAIKAAASKTPQPSDQ
ncbi:hypothetical protein [Nevskia sp.]|uniref:hypothetical protein n=1 Tax=Nevskia sp. TaxID=1929292 RepID=UPI0025F6F55F|nr:hypothetical protein [Nevskia sp.]